MMENTAKLLNEIAELKEKLHKHGKAIERIEQWYTTETREKNVMARETERQTLETVLRIFRKEVGIKWINEKRKDE